MLFAMEVRQDIFQPDKEEEQLYMMDISVCINTGNKCIKITMCLELILWMKSCQTDMVSHGAGFTTKFFFTVKWKGCSYCLFLLYFLNCIYTKRSNCDCTFDHVTIKTFNVKCNQNVGPRGERVDSQTTTCLKYKAPSHPHSHTHSHMNKRYKKQCMESNSISTSRFVSQAEKKKKKNSGSTTGRAKEDRYSNTPLSAPLAPDVIPHHRRGHREDKWLPCREHGAGGGEGAAKGSRGLMGHEMYSTSLTQRKNRSGRK